MIDDGNGWLQMLQDRNLTSHTYVEKTALDIYENIRNKYVILFDEFLDEIKKRTEEDW